MLLKRLSSWQMETYIRKFEGSLLTRPTALADELKLHWRSFHRGSWLRRQDISLLAKSSADEVTKYRTKLSLSWSHFLFLILFVMAGKGRRWKYALPLWHIGEHKSHPDGFYIPVQS